MKNSATENEVRSTPEIYIATRSGVAMLPGAVTAGLKKGISRHKSSAAPYTRQVINEERYTSLKRRNTRQSTINSPVCIAYSACPKLKTPVFRLNRYAGATIIEIPKSAAERIATASDNKAIARK